MGEGKPSTHAVANFLEKLKWGEWLEGGHMEWLSEEVQG